MSAGFNPEIVKTASQDQRTAADPSATVFVEANAGSGKTRVLVDRVARLLLQGAKPDRMLCVTFTKAAAGEMQSRLFKKLGEWSTLPNEKLQHKLQQLTGGESNPDLAAARRLFARALETPGGLKIQTLHAFCESLLRRFPLEAGLPPGFEVQDDAEAAALKTACMDRLFANANMAPDGSIANAINVILDAAGPDGIDRIASLALAQRGRLSALLDEAGSIETFTDRASLALGVPPELDETLALETIWSETAVDDLEAALSGLQAGGSKTEIVSADKLAWALEASERKPSEAARRYLVFWLTTSGTLKKPGSIYGKKTGETYKILVTLFGEEGSERHRIEGEVMDFLANAKANSATRAGLTLASAMIREYTHRLRRIRKVDFSDLVERARALLTDTDAKVWALYKLDQGLDHVLVDEAQDTAPDQWAVINALTEEFFAGEGARELSELERSVFCVGDEKQSIYSFQNADPALFLAQRRRLEQDAKAAGRRFESPGLNVSFRSSSRVLTAVDAAFFAEATALNAPERKDDAARLETKFLMTDPETETERDALAFHRYDGHSAARAEAFGCVEVWPAIPKPEAPEVDKLDLRPVDHERKDSARNQLAAAVADEIGAILKRGDAVCDSDDPSIQKPATPGDIIVLVRKRGGLFEEIIRQLKLKQIPVAGADRMTLPDQLVVEDLLSLARFALLPEDSLSLAEVLKSPFFHPVGDVKPRINDDALFDLSRGSGRGLWEKLRRSDDSRFAEAREVLERVRRRVDTVAPYAFFAVFLTEASDTGETRLARLYARLGEEARDPAEEFLSRALDHERDGAPSLTRFVEAVSGDASDIKREMEAGRGEVRVMTVHGAKGLEAPIVFLPDTTQSPTDRAAGLYVHDKAGFIWAPDSKMRPPLVQSLKDRADLAADGEYQRLLYVAMTRARDRLIVCGHTYGNGGRVDEGSWHDRIWRAATRDGWKPVDTVLSRQAEENGWPVAQGLRLGTRPKALGKAVVYDGAAITRPAWMNEPAPVDPPSARPMAPSRLLDDEDGGFDPSPLSPLSDGGPDRFRRGSLIHKLLQTLPDLPEDRRESSAKTFLASKPDLTEAQREEIISETLRVIDDPAFADLFGPGSRAEVALSGRAPGLPEGITVNGQIDRLVITDHEVLIVDYKTNRPPPTEVEDVATGYVGQMAAYRAILQALHPDRPVRCALLWTDAPRLMELPAELMERVLTRAKQTLGA
ncbi:UvrD-helicase domain-containing protein [Maricaulaceae bacterium EIL42A08]|nr:UvrD-helicase domain-containing protein [Maricaulaceae bacterium EIL42A08]